MKIPQRIKIIRFVAEQGVVTVGDVQSFLGNSYSTNAMRVTLYKTGFSHLKFGNILHGIWSIQEQKLLDLLKTYFEDFPNIPVREVHYHQVHHALGMNKIRIILENTEDINIVDWWSENYIRALPKAKREGFSFQKFPDAVFFRERANGTKQKFFIEYERSLKNRARYMELFQFYASRDDVQNRNVIYICGDGVIKKELMKAEALLVKSGKLRAVGKYFQFMTLDKFCERYSVSPNKEEEKCVV